MATDSPLNLYHAKKPPIQTAKKVVGSISKYSNKHKTVSKHSSQLKIFDSSNKNAINDVKSNLQNLFDDMADQSPMSSQREYVQ